jgi:energy-converting hydrogenase Eha subunit G
MKNKESFFLIFVGIGVFLVSLTYGVVPNTTLSFLYDIEVNSINLSNIFRAIMGLYIALVIFWIAGAKYENLRLPALWSLTIFMSGLAIGRALSIIVDGIPYTLFINWMAIEFICAYLGFKLIKGLQKD